MMSDYTDKELEELQFGLSKGMRIQPKDITKTPAPNGDQSGPKHKMAEGVADQSNQACEVENCPHHTQEPPLKERHLKPIISNLEAELDNTLKRVLEAGIGYPTDEDMASGYRKGVLTTAKSQLKQLILKDVLEMVGVDEDTDSLENYILERIDIRNGLKEQLRQSARKRYQ